VKVGARGPVHKDVVDAIAVDGGEGKVVAQSHVAQGPKKDAEAGVPRLVTVDDEGVGLVVEHEDDVGVGEQSAVLDRRRKGAKRLSPLDLGASGLSGCVVVGRRPQTATH
jgi:hypothetical protein